MTDGATWGTFEQALPCPGADGVGFVFSDDDPYVGVDLDGCREPESGQIEPWAQEIVDLLGSYTEISPSGTGVHVIVRGVISGDRRRSGQFEVYSEARYFTMTGWHLAGTPREVRERTAQLAEVCREIFEYAAVEPESPRSLRLSLADDELVARASSAANGPKFRALWAGDTTGYPSHSEADLALAAYLPAGPKPIRYASTPCSGSPVSCVRSGMSAAAVGPMARLRSLGRCSLAREGACPPDHPLRSR